MMQSPREVGRNGTGGLASDRGRTPPSLKLGVRMGCDKYQDVGSGLMVVSFVN